MLDWSYVLIFACPFIKVQMRIAVPIAGVLAARAFLSNTFFIIFAFPIAIIATLE